MLVTKTNLLTRDRPALVAVQELGLQRLTLAGFFMYLPIGLLSVFTAGLVFS
jgi:hypothetical protein